MLKKLIIGTTLMCAAATASAAIITDTYDIAIQTTNFDRNDIVLDKFDDLGGTRTLNSVMFTLNGVVNGNARVESQDAAPAIVVTTLEATLTLSDSAGMELIVVIPSVSRTFNADTYDGVLDFGGTSGITYPNLDAALSKNSAVFTDQAILDAYTAAAPATSNFLFDAKATSLATGAGNLFSNFQTNAGGTVTVTYDYSLVPVVQASAPAHIALLGFGLLAFAGFRKARK